MNPEIQSFIEAGGEQNISNTEVSTEDLVRVQESEGKAKQIAGQIAASQKQGSQIAQFLTIVLQELYDQSRFWDNIGLFAISGQESLSHTFLHEELVAMLAPFMNVQADECGLQNVLPIDYHFSRTLPSLTSYYSILNQQYERIRFMDREKMRAFLLVMLEHYGVIRLEEIEDKSMFLVEL